MTGDIYMYTLSVDKVISTAHQLRDYDGPCARVHGHNWKIQMVVQSKDIDDRGIAIDFNEMDEKLWEVIGPFDHQLINSIPPFDKINPTAENLVKYIFEQLKSKFSGHVTLKKVSAWETDAYMVSYEE
jgi:6-pyruvoyltetrahydropterin/6-carboxytetrahydropterin synthase